MSGSDTRGRALHVALVHRDFRYLFASRAISGTGNWLYNVALLATDQKVGGSNPSARA